jgi:hypothetical protein
MWADERGFPISLPQSVGGTLCDTFAATDTDFCINDREPIVHEYDLIAEKSLMISSLWPIQARVHDIDQVRAMLREQQSFAADFHSG